MHKKVTKRMRLTWHLMVYLKVHFSMQFDVNVMTHLKVRSRLHLEIYIKIVKKVYLINAGPIFNSNKCTK